jgi:hypothetical protein
MNSVRNGGGENFGMNTFAEGQLPRHHRGKGEVLGSRHWWHFSGAATANGELPQRDGTNVEVIIMHLVEVFLPLNTNDGTPQPIELFRPVREQLADQFGGVTAFTRNPAKGISLLEDNERAEDDIIVYEVIVEAFDRHWWQSYKRDLEERFQQEEILIRVTAVSLVR